ncbi:hypothetical protein ECDEC15B_1300 [Escherichia coli DEC15B]|nr:hypothetical protein ECDEC15B_1300 [Escherichia coli DEC15B]
MAVQVISLKIDKKLLTLVVKAANIVAVILKTIHKEHQKQGKKVVRIAMVAAVNLALNLSPPTFVNN